MTGFIVFLLAIGVVSKRIDIIVDRGKLALNSPVYLLGTFLASWLGAANILWAFIALYWPFPVAGLALGVILSLLANRNNVVSLIAVKMFFDATISFSSLYLWIALWPFHRHY